MSDELILPRVLRYALPMQRGEDVQALQRLLLRADPDSAAREIRVVDGCFGPATRRAVLAFQSRAGLAEVDGVVGPKTWTVLQRWRHGAGPRAEELGAAMADMARASGPGAVLAAALPALMQPHAVFAGGITWRLTADGVALGEAPVRVSGSRLAVQRAFDWFGAELRGAAIATGVPIELLVATACTEVLGDTRRFATPEAAARARREEPGFRDDAATPHRVSIGLMQTLVSTARQVLPLPAHDPAMARITATTLTDPAQSILAGASFIAAQTRRTRLDPPVVACAYNAGGVYEQRGAANHWRMRQYPIGTPNHADRFVTFFNQALHLLTEDPARAGAAPSVRAALRGEGSALPGPHPPGAEGSWTSIIFGLEREGASPQRP